MIKIVMRVFSKKTMRANTHKFASIALLNATQSIANTTCARD